MKDNNFLVCFRKVFLICFCDDVVFEGVVFVSGGTIDFGVSEDEAIFPKNLVRGIFLQGVLVSIIFYCWIILF